MRGSIGPDLGSGPGTGGGPGSRHLLPTSADHMPLLVVAAVLVATYGYEVFSFSLTLDEPVFGLFGQRALLNTWVASGRWGMGVVAAVMPPMVVPGLTTSLGVVLTATGVWWLARRVHELRPWTSAALTALCVTLPMILLHLSFMTNAVGVGLGFVLTSVVAERLGRLERALDLPALAMTVFVLAVYEAFGLVSLAVALGMLVRRPDPRLARRWVVLLGVAVVVSRFVGYCLRWVLQVSTSDYSSSMLDLGGLLGDPAGRIVDGFTRAYSVLAPGGAVFDLGSPWLALVLSALAALAVGSVARQGGSRTERALRWASLALLLGVPFVGGVLVVEIPLRSMLYLPAVVVSLAAVVLTGPPLPPRAARMVRYGIVGTGVLALFANASVGNRALASAEVALVHDRYVAMRIDEERRQLLPGAQAPVPVYVTPVERWPDSTLAPGLEHLGLSLFSGESWRATSFLEGLGVPVMGLTPEQEASAVATAAGMPVYPQDGWAQAVDGVLVVRLR